MIGTYLILPDRAFTALNLDSRKPFRPSAANLVPRPAFQPKRVVDSHVGVPEHPR